MLWTTFVNAISLKPFPQSTSNFVFISSRGRILLTLDHLIKTRWLPSNLGKCMLWTTLVKAIYLEPFPQSTSYLKFVFILSRRRTLLTLGHLLKTRWSPSNFLKCVLHRQALWTRYLWNHFTNRLLIWFMMAYYLKERHFWFRAFC